MGNNPSNPYGMYSATAIERDKPELIDKQEWKLITPYFGKPYWVWVGTGPAKPCGSWYQYKVADYNHGQQIGYTYPYKFEGPPCPQKGGKKRKSSKKTRKGSRR